MKRTRRRLKRYLLLTGRNLDLFARPKYRIARYYKRYNSIKKIDAGFKGLDKEAISEALSYCQYIYEEEEERQQQIENKAVVLAGFSGTIAAVALTFFALFLNSEQFRAIIKPLQVVGVSCSCSIILVLLVSILFSIRAIATRYFDRPQPMRIFDLAQKDVTEVQARRVTELFYSYLKNQYNNDRKLDNFSFALRCFQFGVWLLLILVLVLTAYGLTLGGDTSNITPTGLPIYTATATTQSTPTNSSTLTATASPAFTQTPMSTQTEMKTPTSLPVSTQASTTETITP